MLLLRRAVLLCLWVAACGPDPGADEGGSLSETSETSDTSGSTGTDAPTGGALADPWQRELDGCGGLYGAFVLADGDVVVVGERAPEGLDDQPFAARYAPDGTEVWTQQLVGLAPEAGFVAVAPVDDGSDEFIAVGYLDDEESPERPLLVRLAVADGAVVWTRDEAPAEGALYGATWSKGQATLWTTGTAGGDVLIAAYDGEGSRVDTAVGPAGGFAPAVGFAAASAGDDVVYCGRASTGEGGAPWVARYAGDVATWSALGPDPGVGAFSDCWDVAVGPGLVSASVEAGYAGARVALYDAAGGLQWEFAEPNAGAQAVTVDADGSVLVAGWSASRDPMMMMTTRSHSSGERHGWLRRFGADGSGPEHSWLDVDLVSPRDLAIHPGGGVVIVGQRLPTDGCGVPWLGRFAD